MAVVQWAFPFNKPVDLKLYKDYLKFVERPMDFGTIKKKLEGGQYRTLDMFAKDMRQVLFGLEPKSWMGNAEMPMYGIDAA